VEKAVVIDIDGVILDTSNIDDKNWDFFNKNCNNDDIKPFKGIKQFLNSFDRDVNIIISTARNEFIRSQTARKLWKYRIYFDDMYMRSYNDLRADFEIKKDHLNEITKKYDVICFIDDNEKNCKIAQEFNILTFSTTKRSNNAVR